MIIKKIILTNYRQYKGKQEIPLGFEKDKNINIIVGVNGAGKTNLLNALNWCLYGREDHLAESSIHHEMLNDSVRVLLKPGEKADVSVEMICENERGWGFRIIRRKEFLKGKENRILPVREEVSAFIKLPHREDWDPRPPEFIINYKILPYGVKDFFFFDGEKLIKLFEERTAEKVKNAILDVSQISLIDVTLDHLEKKKYEYYKESKKISPQIGELNEKIEATRKGLDELKMEIEEYEKSKREIENSLREIENKLRGYSEERIKELESQYQELENERTLLREEIIGLEEELKGLLITDGPLVLCKDALEIIERLMKEKYEKGELPPPATEDFIKELLERGRCLCGADISRGERRRNVEDFLETISTISTKLDEECRRIKPELKEVLEVTETFFDRKKTIGQRLIEKRDKLKKIEDKLRDLMIKLKNLNIEEIKSLISQKEEYEKQKEDIIATIATKNMQKEYAERQIKEWESKLKKELRKQEKLSELNTKIEIIENCINVLREIKNEILEEVRATVENFTFEYFKELIWKKQRFKEIKIDKDYTVTIINRYGLKTSTSAGEKEILALSFMAALRKVSGFEAPVIIDTPLARISKEHRLNIANALPKYLQDTQIILLLTDEEYTEDIKRILEPRTVAKYLLQYDDEKDETRVVKW